MNDDGCFDKSELKALFLMLKVDSGANVEVTDELVDRVMKDFDLSGNQVLEREEFAPLIKRIMLRVVYEMRKKLNLR